MSKKTKSKSNKISTGVMDLTRENQGDFVYYRVACDCSSQECDCVIQMEYDKDFGDISISFYKDLHTEQKYWSDEVSRIWDDIKKPKNFMYVVEKTFLKLLPALYKLIYRRLKFGVSVLFTGHAKFEGEFLIFGEKHINDFIFALEQGRDKIVDFNKKLKEDK